MNRRLLSFRGAKSAGGPLQMSSEPLTPLHGGIRPLRRWTSLVAMCSDASTTSSRSLP